MALGYGIALHLERHGRGLVKGGKGRGRSKRLSHSTREPHPTWAEDSVAREHVRVTFFAKLPQASHQLAGPAVSV